MSLRALRQARGQALAKQSQLNGPDCGACPEHSEGSLLAMTLKKYMNKVCYFVFIIWIFVSGSCVKEPIKGKGGYPKTAMSCSAKFEKAWSAAKKILIEDLKIEPYYIDENNGKFSSRWINNLYKINLSVQEYNELAYISVYTQMKDSSGGVVSYGSLENEILVKISNDLDGKCK